MNLLRLTSAKSYALLFFTFLYVSSAFAQIADTHPSHPGHERCSTVKMDSIRHAQNPDLQTNEEFEEWIQKLIAQKKRFQSQGLIINGVYQIPIVVHVVHDGEPIGTGRNLSVAAVQSQIDVMNEDFRRIFGTNGYNTDPDGADTQIEFCLARRRPDGSAFPAGEDGINRVDAGAQFGGGPTYSTAQIDGTIKPWFTATQFGGWDPGTYMNFWSIDLQGGLLGYAQFPTTVLGGMGCNAQNITTDGVVMDFQTIGKSAVTGFPGPFNEGRTATHEVGHWLGLRHIWGDGGCGVDDFCLDTPESDASNGGCPTGHVSCGTVDMIENYMDYTNDLCMNIFTNDQKMRMRTVLENSPIRASLINSDACIPPAVSDASIVGISSPDGDNCAGAITPTVVLRNRGASNLTSVTISYTLNNGAATSFAWTGNIAPGAENNVNLPAFTAPLGVHDFRAYTELPNGVIDPDPTYDTTLIAFAVSNGFMPNYSEDFEGGTFPPDVRWSVDNPNGDCYEWVGQACVSSSGAANNVAAQMTNFNNGTNQDEYLYTPFFILPCNASAANVSFDKAYRRRLAGSNDRLRLEMSDDCGASWSTVLFDQSGGTLDGPNGTDNGYWIPTAAGEWQNVNIDLLPFVTGTSQSVQFRFRATNDGNGGNLYIDNFDFTATTPGEIELTASGNDVLDGGIFNFGAGPLGGTVTTVFTITNTGTSDLILTGPISVTGDAEFALNATFGSTTVAPGATTTFSIDFTASGAGPFTGNVSFGTNDCDEGIYNFELTGTGDVVPPTAGFTSTPTEICAGSTVTYSDASTGAASHAWSFPGGTPSSATGPGPHVITYSAGGVYGASLTVTNPFGTDTDTQPVTVVVLPAGVPLPVSEGFNSGTFAPLGWTVINDGNQAIAWTQDPNNNGTAPTPGNSARIDFFSQNNTGDQDSLIMIPMDFTGLSSAQMTFDVAYARYNATFADSLQVVVSTDCGSSWFIEYAKGPSSNLATDADQTGGYTAPSTWRNESINLDGYVGNDNVLVGFVGISGWGQYIYIDNVNLTGVAGCTESDVPILSAAPGTYCEGDVVTINITGDLNDATEWSVYSGSCGGALLGTTATGTFDVTLAAGSNDYFIRGEGGCAALGTCGTVSITAGAIPSAPVVTVVDNCGSSTLTATGTNLLWSTGETTSSITVATAGTYIVTQTVGGCTSANGSGVANPTAIPSAPVVTVVDNCGSSTLTATGTNLLWSTGETTSSITVATAGTYTVTQTVGGCTSANGSGVANPTAIPSAPVVTVVDNCGSSTLTATGTNLFWSTGETTSSITVATAGTYTVTQTVGGCTSANGSGVANPTATPSAPVVTVVDNCGSSTLTATGTNLLWSTGETTSSITVATAGTYTVTQTVGGCTSANGSGVANPTAIPSAPVVTVVDNCGSSTLTATGTNLLWSTGETTSSITVATAGTYTVTQTVGGCTSANGSGVANPTAIPSAPVVTVVDNCGSSTLTATGTNLLWSTGETTSSITVATAGTYIVTQTVGGCTSANGSGVANPTAIPSAPVVTVVDNCGSSTLTATGTNLLWSTGETTSSITVATAGTYTVTQTVGGCTSTNGSAVANPLSGVTITSGTLTDPTSCGNNDGSIVVNGSGTGVVSWSGASLGVSGTVTLPYTITGLTAGSYAITFNDGCSSNTLNETLSDPLAPSAPVVTVVDNCGSSTLTATGTNLLWSTGETTSSITVATAGTYIVTQTVGGCTSANGSGVANPTAIPSAPVVTVVDNCGSSTLTATGTNLLWSTGETASSITVATAGTYTVTQTVGGCTSANGSGVANPTAIPSAPVVTVVDNCGSSTLTATGTNLLWSTGETTSSITVATAGTYIVTQTVGGCTSANGSGVANPTAIPSAPVVTVVDNCGSSTLTATGTNLLWSTGETTSSITVATAGTYTVTQTVGGCTSTNGSAVANPLSGVTITSGTLTDPTSCGNNDGSIVVNGSGTGVVSWSGASLGVSGTVTLPYTITGLTAGSYAITFNDGCSSNTLNETLSDPLAPSAPVVTVVDNCGSSTLTATGTNLLWSTGETTSSITVATAGTYIVTQTVGGCTSANGSGVANPTAIPSAPVVTVVDNCGSSTLTATGTNLLWSTGETASSITVATAGTYTVTQTVGGCTSANGPGVANPTAIPSAPVVTVVDNCGSSTLTATGTNLLWSTGETTSSITVATAGTYTVTQTAGGCTSANGSGVANPLTIPTPTTEDVTACDSYTWAATGVTYVTGGSYTTTLASSNGCDSVVTLNLTINNSSIGSETASACEFYTWPTNGVTYTASGIYTAVLANAVGCDSIVSLDLTINLPSTGSEAVTVCDSYVWSADSNTYTATGTYTAILTNAAGCDSVVTLNLTVQGVPDVLLALTIQEFCDSDVDITLAGATPSGGVYSGAGVSGGVFSPSIAGIGTHTITYAYTDVNGCTGTDTDVIEVQDCAKVDELVTVVSVYPNPTTGIVTLTSNGVSLEELRVFDNSGKLIDVLVLNGVQEEVNISEYARGVYQFQIKTGDNTRWERVVKN